MVKDSLIQSKVPGLSPASDSFCLPSFFLLFPFLVCFVCFSININLTNCYLIKCDKQKEKVLCFQSKDSILNTLYMDKQSEFLSFPTIYCGKTRVDNHLIIFQTTFPRVDDSLSLISTRRIIGKATSV